MNVRAEQEAAGDLRRNGILSENPSVLIQGTGWHVVWAVLREAVLRLWEDDATGLAGSVAFRAVLAIFPFLIFASSLTAFVGDRAMADGLVTFLIAIVPPSLVEPLVSEVVNVLTIQRGGILSLGVLLTIWFALGGVDGVRVGLNRCIRHSGDALYPRRLWTGDIDRDLHWLGFRPTGLPPRAGAAGGLAFA